MNIEELKALLNEKIDDAARDYEAAMTFDRQSYLTGKQHAFESILNAIEESETVIAAPPSKITLTLETIRKLKNERDEEHALALDAQLEGRKDIAAEHMAREDELQDQIDEQYRIAAEKGLINPAKAGMDAVAHE